MKSKLLLCILSFLFLVPLLANQYEVRPNMAGSTPVVLVSEVTPIAASVDVYSTSSIKQYIRNAFPNAPVMSDIASCESRFRQFNLDGSVYRGRANPHDIGLLQINETYHLEEATKLGMDIYTLDGNVAFAKVLYERNGTRDWNWSKEPIGKFQGWAQGECTS
jgi:hypothetical protein